MLALGGAALHAGLARGVRKAARYKQAASWVTDYDLWRPGDRAN